MNKRLIDDISKFIFVEDSIKEADIIFIPGGSYPQLAEEAAKIWKEGFAPLIMPSGGVSIKTGKFNGVKAKKNIYSKDYVTEFEFLKDVLLYNGVTEDAILCEDKASYTKQNASLSKIILESHSIKIDSAIICCKSYHSRRCLMCYQLVFPDVQFYVHPISTTKNGSYISKETWMQSQTGIKMVLGELEKNGNQFTEDFLSKES